eukprot:scaffold30274_cov67-Cyclotella_meneghiniana.AAC.11
MQWRATKAFTPILGGLSTVRSLSFLLLFENLCDLDAPPHERSSCFVASRRILVSGHNAGSVNIMYRDRAHSRTPTNAMNWHLGWSWGRRCQGGNRQSKAISALVEVELMLPGNKVDSSTGENHLHEEARLTDSPVDACFRFRWNKGSRTTLALV